MSCFLMLWGTSALLYQRANAAQSLKVVPHQSSCPTGILNNLAQAGTPGANGSFLFPLALNGLGSNETSDILAGDFNGDGNQDVLIGSLRSDEVALFLGRGNGGFTRAPLGILFFGTQVNYSDSIAFVQGTAVTASAGTVVSMATVHEFRSVINYSRVAIAIDYAANAGSLTPPPDGDAVLYLDINANGYAINNTAFYPGSGGTSIYISDPVAVAVGKLNTNGTPVVAVSCSGVSNNGGGSGGFLAIDVQVNTTIDQRIGGGINASSVVVPEDNTRQSGSLFDCRSYGNAPGPSQVNSNTYNLGTAQGNRRLFSIPPRTTYPAGIAPRAIAFGNSAHRSDGVGDLFFVAQDWGSAGGSSSIAVPAPTKTTPENAIFCLVSNNHPTTPRLLRNARSRTEPYDFGTSSPSSQGQQDGFILRTSGIPAGVALGDFNQDTQLDVACATNSGLVSISLSGQISSFQDSSGQSSGPQISGYPDNLTSFTQVGGTPNTVYVQDLNNDQRLDICGTNNLTEGGFALLSGITPGLFQPGQLTGAVTPEDQLGATRALAVTPVPLTGIPGNQPEGRMVNFNGGPADIVFSRTALDSNVAVRYDGTPSPNQGIAYGLIYNLRQPNPIIISAGSSVILPLATACSPDIIGPNPTIGAFFSNNLLVNNFTVSNQTVFGRVNAPCAAGIGTFRGTFYIYSNNPPMLASTALEIQIVANNGPTLGSYPETSTTAGTLVTVSPTAPPGDGGTVASVTATASPGFAGNLSIHPLTGAVSVNTPNQGTFTITVTATNNCGRATVRTFTLNVLSYGKSPVVTSVSPNVGPQGTSVTLTGFNLNTVQAVTFNGTAASFTIDSPTQITTVVPRATTGPISVSGPTGTSVGPVFTVIRTK
ncbi:MAG: hypothetical protein K1Y36_01060 [Blastocatellia bacterium]|nr:hypothetical protein [Blastocatellia bacterium]